MTTINMSAPTNRPTNRLQVALSPAISDKLSNNRAGGGINATLVIDSEPLTVSFSQAGKKLLEDKKDAELKEKMRQALEENRAKSEKLAE
jgi:hypothetical protein